MAVEIYGCGGTSIGDLWLWRGSTLNRGGPNHPPPSWVTTTVSFPLLSPGLWCFVLLGGIIGRSRGGSCCLAGVGELLNWVYRDSAVVLPLAGPELCVGGSFPFGTGHLGLRPGWAIGMVDLKS